MINISELTKADVGRWVIYTDGQGKQEEGRLKSWNDTFIFVVYKCDNQWHRYQDFTGQATSPRNLTWKF